MTLIDQRIVIDAPPHVVWDYISDPTQIKRWHAGYHNISVLTTQQMGLGTRRRCTLATGGKDVIEEITAWAEGFGYEYTLIEGGSFRALKGRLRLTAGPSGTTVQWTVTYTRKGLFGKIRDMFGGQRQMQAMMAESLRRLRHLVDELGLRMDADYRARVSMRDRMDHEARLQYQRRYHHETADMPPAAEDWAEESAPQADSAHTAEPPRAQPPAAHIAEPSALRAAEVPAPPPEEDIPILEADVAADVEIPEDGVPAFVDDLLNEEEPSADYSHTADTEPKPPAGLREALDVQEPTGGIEAQRAQEDSAAPVPAPADTPAASAPKRHTSQDMPAVDLPLDDDAVPAAEAPPRTSPTYTEDDAPPDEADLEHTRPTPPRGIQSVREQATMTPVSPDPDSAAATPTPPRGTPSVSPRIPTRESGDRAPLPPPTPKTDTGEISIWEVFGTERPSEQDEHALQDLIQSVNARESAAAGRRPRGARRAPRVRHIRRGIGLRQRLMIQYTRVRRFDMSEE